MHLKEETQLEVAVKLKISEDHLSKTETPVRSEVFTLLKSKGCSVESVEDKMFEYVTEPHKEICLHKEECIR